MKKLLTTQEGLAMILTDVKGWLLGIVIAFFVITYSLSTQAFVAELKGPKSPIVVVAGKEFEYCRTIKYLKKVRIELSKEVVYYIDHKEVIYPPLAIQKFTREKGERLFCKSFMFPPHAKTGKYIMYTEVTATFPPFWKNTYQFQDIEITVVKDK